MRQNALTIFGMVAIGYWATPVLVPVILSFFLFLLLDPLVQWATMRTKIHRGILSPIFVLLSAVVVSLVVWGGYSASSKIIQQIPQYTGKIRSAVRAFQGKAETIQKGTMSFLPKQAEKGDVQRVEVVSDGAGSWTPALLRGIDSVVGVITSIFLIPILALFLLLEKPHLKSVMTRVLAVNTSVDRLGNEMSQLVKGFFFGNFLVAIGASAAFYALFKIIGLDNSLSLALLAGIINLIPLLGAILGAAFPMAQAFLQFDTLGPALLVLGCSLVFHLIIGNVLIPKVVGSRINVNATAATIGLIFWAWLWGPIGLLLAVPLTAMIRIFLSSKPSTSPWADLLAESSKSPLSLIWVPKGLRKKG